MDAVSDFLRFLGTNQMVLGICSMITILGIVLTLIIVFKTSNIAKVCANTIPRCRIVYRRFHK